MCLLISHAKSEVRLLPLTVHPLGVIFWGWGCERERQGALLKYKGKIRAVFLKVWLTQEPTSTS